MRECYLIDAVRTARGRLSRPQKGFVGELANIHPTTLGATGGILLATMINELERERLRYGLITL